MCDAIFNNPQLMSALVGAPTSAATPAAASAAPPMSDPYTTAKTALTSALSGQPTGIASLMTRGTAPAPTPMSDPNDPNAPKRVNGQAPPVSGNGSGVFG